MGEHDKMAEEASAVIADLLRVIDHYMHTVDTETAREQVRYAVRRGSSYMRAYKWSE